MRKLVTLIIISCTTLSIGGKVQAHNVWAHAQQITPEGTLGAFKLAADPCGLERKMMVAWFETSISLEHGVLAEFEAKILGTKLKPELFVETLNGLLELKTIIHEYEESLITFKKFLDKGQTEPNFNARLTKILAEADIPRLSLLEVRYSDVSGMKRKLPPPPVGIEGLIGALIDDLHILEAILDETIDGTRDAIPIAKKGDFAKVMLSGRNKFGDKMPQLSDAISMYDRLYTELVLATIAATMQVFPKGFEFLE